MSVPGWQRLEVVHEGPTFRLMDYRCRLPACHDSPEESPESHQIVFVRSGLFVAENPRGRFVADANQILFFSPGRPYKVTHPLPGGDDCLVLTTSEADRADVLADTDPRYSADPTSAFPFEAALNTARACVLQRQLLSRARSGAGALDLEETALELAAEAVGSAARVPFRRVPAARPAVARRRREAVESVKVMLAARLASPPSLREIARSVGYTPFHLLRVFAAEVGVPIRRYLTRLRLRSALERLAEAGTDLTELALDLGYADHSHFTNTFRREFGLSPSAFRATANVRRLSLLQKPREALPRL